MERVCEGSVSGCGRVILRVQHAGACWALTALGGLGEGKPVGSSTRDHEDETEDRIGGPSDSIVSGEGASVGFPFRNTWSAAATPGCSPGFVQSHLCQEI